MIVAFLPRGRRVPNFTHYFGVEPDKLDSFKRFAGDQSAGDYYRQDGEGWSLVEAERKKGKASNG